MSQYVEIFYDNLNFLNADIHKIDRETFFYKLENFDIFDTLGYEKFCIGFQEINISHAKINFFDKNLLSNIIHMQYGITRTYVFEQENISFLHKGKQYSFNDFNALLDEDGLSFVDYGLFLFSYLLQQYCTNSALSLKHVEQYILNKHLFYGCHLPPSQTITPSKND
jgi:hypothetical protein